MNNLKYYLSLVERIFEEESFVAEPRELYEPIDYTLRLGGKRIRPTLLLAANALFGGNTDEVRGAALGIETFHNFTLLHDDLMDRSPLRRGQPTVYQKWDENTAVLSGDTMYALAWRYFLRQPSPRLHSILLCFCETGIEVCEGQQKDMNFERMTLEEVSLDDYRDMIRQKTAVLLAGALKIGALYANAPDEEVARLYEFGVHLGLAFQLQDDLLDGYGDTAVFGKKTGQDIRDNKKSYLPLLAMQIGNDSQRNELLALFATKDNMDEEEKVRRVMALYERMNLKSAVEEAIEMEFKTAEEYLNYVHADEALKLPLRELMETLAGRKK
ncbi:MAG: polyprenyl synthetase family protein [Bacteroidales bacterium]|nr:polyprenyl synthetase family protein [Bacteroidales bacterium]MBR5092230.1 polyprenyl synthetase family protein [Bacteroidales bacterium]